MLQLVPAFDVVHLRDLGVSRRLEDTELGLLRKQIDIFMSGLDVRLLNGRQLKV